MARVLPRTRARKYATLLEIFKEPFQEASDSNSRLFRWAKLSSDNQCGCHDWACSSILLEGLQRQRNLLSKPRNGRIQEASRWKTTAELPLTENENIDWSCEGVEQTAQIDSNLTLRLHSPNIQWVTHREHLSRALETIKDDLATERKSTINASSSIYFNGWRIMPPFHQNNWAFASNIQRQHDSFSFFSTSALTFCSKPLLSLSMWTSPRLSINCGMTACFTNCTEWTVHMNSWTLSSNTWRIESVTSKWIKSRRPSSTSKKMCLKDPASDRY